MTQSGQSKDPGIINDMMIALHNETNGYMGHRYLGCVEQAQKLKSQEEKQKYDDQWTFMTGKNGPELNIDHYHLYHHWWLTAKSSNPKDPVVVLDPFRDTVETKKQMKQKKYD